MTKLGVAKIQQDYHAFSEEPASMKLCDLPTAKYMLTMDLKEVCHTSAMNNENEQCEKGMEIDYDEYRDIERMKLTTS